MRRLVLAAATLCAVAGTALWSAAERSPAPPPGSSLTIAAAPGRAAAVSRELARLGSPVTVRVGSLLQVRARARAGGAAAARPGVAGVGPAAVARPDQVISQGVERIGADALRARRPRRHRHPHRRRRPRLRRDLAQPARQGAAAAGQIDAIESFDRTSGRPDITGTSSDDQPTGHGANVAQVVWDIAPGARYTLVNYHTQLELSQAVDWLVNGPDGKPRVDVVVHSNSFLDGPFDGTGIAAQAVDRAHAAGIFWANSGRQLRGPSLGGRRRRSRPATAGPTSGPRPAATSRSRSARTSAWGRRSTGATARAGAAPNPASSARFQLAVTDTAPSGARRVREGQADASQPAGRRGLPARCDGHATACASGRARRGVVCKLEIFGGGVELGDEATEGVEHPDARGRARLVHGGGARLGGRRRGALLVAGPDAGRPPQARRRRARPRPPSGPASRWSARRPRRRTRPERPRC